MDIETILTVIASLGLGFIGGYLQHLWSQKRNIEERIQSQNLKLYESILIFMRIVLDPKMVDHFNIEKEDPILTKLTNYNEIRYFARKKLKEFYYSSVVSSPDEVLKSIKDFLTDANEDTFLATALAMRKDLWRKKTKVNIDMLSLKETM